MQHLQSTPPHVGSYQGLIFGLDPLKVEHAKMIVDEPQHHTALRRALAFRTLAEARGKTVNSNRLILMTLKQTEGSA